MTQKETKTGRRILALTFDDGPNPDTTLPLLELLQHSGIPASFFVLGKKLTPRTIPVVRRAAALGCEICNHSYSHRDMTKLSPEQIRREIEKTDRLIRKAVGQSARFFRPPYIAVNQTMIDQIGLPFIAGFGAEDYNPEVSAEERFRRIMASVRDGAVILLHDAKGNTQTVEACAALIPALKAEGYSFVTMTELFAEKGIVPQKGIIYSYAEQTEPYA